MFAFFLQIDRRCTYSSSWHSSHITRALSFVHLPQLRTTVTAVSLLNEMLIRQDRSSKFGNSEFANETSSCNKLTKSVSMHSDISIRGSRSSCVSDDFAKSIVQRGSGMLPPGASVLRSEMLRFGSTRSGAWPTWTQQCGRSLQKSAPGMLWHSQTGLTKVLCWDVGKVQLWWIKLLDVHYDRLFAWW